MRALLTLALTLLMAAIAVDASLVLNDHPVVVEHKRRQPASGSVATTTAHAFTTPPVVNPLHAGNGTDGWGNVYRRIYELGVAVTTKNYTWVESLLDDNAVIFIADLGCGTMTKAEFVNAVEFSPVLARYFDFGVWAGYQQDAAFLHGTVGAVLSPSAPLPNITVQDDKAYFFGIVNAAGSQLLVFEHISSRALKQENATALVAAWKVLRDASVVHDIAPWEKALTSDFEFHLFTAWSTDYLRQNRTTTLANMQAEWAQEATRYVHEYSSYAVCNFVVADILWSTIRKDGSAQMQRFVISTGFNSDLSVNQISEHTVMPWL
jgi:hypothetical protein